jgi:hypothetical protein
VTNNWETGGFHLTVNKNGLVSLWDNVRNAQSVKGEIYVYLPITIDQAVKLKGAQIAAAELKEGNGF